MENKNFQFETNMNCGGCEAKVPPFLTDDEGNCHWGVDTDNKDKKHALKSEGITEQQVIEMVQKAGLKIKLLNR